MFSEKVINVLYVDDEHYNVHSFTSSFRRIFNVYTASSISDAETILTVQDIHVMIVEQHMSTMAGLKFLMESLSKYPNVVRILLTTLCDKQDLIDAINKAQVFRYVEKPWDSDELQKFITEGYAFYKGHIIRVSSC
ncbi:MAG: atoC [Bacteroidota bacterium]|jgi:response regulator RpfG family c-di-GMP phosphodiesterase|nr:atoC [Bacteroidota bacterium]